MHDAIKAVIFDMDGVLCDSEAIIAAAAVAMFAERYHVEVQPDDFRPFVGTGEDRFLGGVAEKYGAPLKLPEDKDRTYEIYLEMIRDRLQPLPGVHDFIGRCRRAGLKTALASSADMVKVQGNLAAIKVPMDWFGACLTGGDVQNKKPHPEIFLAAARQLDVPPAACLVVEDAPNGVLAAKAARTFCLGLTSSFSSGQLREQGAAWTAADLAHVPEDLQRLLGL